jgi:hypothetical protein
MWQLSGEDKIQIKRKGITYDDLERQWKRFDRGFQPLELLKPATINDGIKHICGDGPFRFYHQLTNKHTIVKFVPASGAATRMMNPIQEMIGNLEKDKMTGAVSSFIKNLSLFAFDECLDKSLKSKGLDLDSLIRNKQYVTILRELLNGEGLDYGKIPKAFIPFHKYGNTFRTAMEEHFVEGAMYCKDKNDVVNIHFTIPEDYEAYFQKLINRLIPLYEKQYSVKYNFSFSFQEQSTDMIARDKDHHPARDADGNLLFRPGGHGALLNNLNALDEDIVFIKNIDNVVHERLLEPTVKHKKLIAGVLYQYKAIINDYIGLLKNGVPDKPVLDKIKSFIEDDLCIHNRPSDLNPHEAVAACLKILQRPLRVCGMVKSQGDTGGGPYWVKNNDGTTSLQIVETSQMDLSNKKQREIFDKATHFNPNDIVCSIKDEEGKKYNLQQFTDPETGIITQKDRNGEKITIQELPGLWNGSMACWNTVFVEVPLVTFNPVKSINDLLNNAHQPA